MTRHRSAPRRPSALGVAMPTANLHVAFVNIYNHTYIFSILYEGVCDPPHVRRRHQPTPGGGKHPHRVYTEGMLLPTISIYWMTYHNRLKRWHMSPGCGPPHGRRRRRHLEGGNGRVRSTWTGSCCGFGPDVAPRCSYGLT